MATNQKVSALSATCTLLATDYLYLVKDPGGSPLSRHISIGDFENSISASVGSVSFTVGASNTWNNELIPVWQGPRSGSYTFVEMDATASGTTTPTLSFNLQRRDFGAMNSAGVDLFAASQVADADGLSQLTFATSVIGPKNHLMFTTGSGAEGGSVNYVTITLYYTK